MTSKYICPADDFYSDFKNEALDHIDNYPSHEIVEISRNEYGEIETRLIKVTSKKTLGT
jgi:hypothetical protein